MRNLPHPDQSDLFEKPVFTVRDRQKLDIPRFRLRMKTAMSQAIRERQLDRQAIADAMARDLGADGFTAAMLTNYPSPSKDHEISLTRFKVFVRVTGATELWDVAVSDDGLLVLEGDEARLAEIARLQQRQREISSKLRSLLATPVNIKREGGNG